MMLLEGGLVYDHDGDTDHPAAADVLIDGNRIVAVAPDLRRAASDPNHPQHGRIGPETQVVDARNRLVIPGFVNAHYHSHDTLLKGFFETIPLELWGLLALPPSFPRRSKRELRARTLIGAVECLYGGITTVQDMDRVHPFDAGDIDAALDAYDEIGIRCIFAPHLTERSLIDATSFWAETIPKEEQWRVAGPSGPLFPPGTDITKEVFGFILPRRGRYPRITFGVGPSSPERLGRATIEALADAARSAELPFYIHLNESRSMAVHGLQRMKDYGGSYVSYLQACGALGPRSSLAHSVWVTDREIEIFKETGTTAALNPVGNLKTRSGVAPFRAFVEAGVNIGLGSDNCSCSDAQNMFQAMKMFCSLAAVSDVMPGAPIAAEAMRAACIGGAKPAGLDRDLGHVRPGMLADLVLLDLTDPSFVPLNSAARQLVFTESGRGVRTVIVDGRILLDDRKLTTIDEAALREEILDIMIEFNRDAAQVSDRIMPISAGIIEAVRRSWDHEFPINRYVGTPPKA